MACSIKDAVKIALRYEGGDAKVENVYDFKELWLVCIDRSYLDIDPDDPLTWVAGGMSDWVVYKDSGKCDVYFPPHFYDVAIQFQSDNPPQPVDKSLWED